MSVNFYDLCRVCTKFANSEEKIHIFSAEGRRKNLNVKIAECLALNVEEKDRLPKVLCAQCLQHIESNIEFREICKKSQVTLITWLNSAANNGPKVYIKDEISPSSGKSLSVLGTTTVAATSTSTATTTAQMPMVTYTTTPTLLQSNNEILNSIVQVAGLQQQTIELNQNADKQQQAFPQYTITVDKNFNKTTQQTVQQAEKDSKANALEEFLKLKPNIKVTPIRKEAAKPQQQQQHSQPQPQIPLQTQQQQQATQSQPQQITVQAQQITLPSQTQATALPQQISQLQLQQLIQQQLQQQWQQQQLQQHLQQLTTQFQPQQITITAPTSSQANLTPTATITPNAAALNESLSPSKSKKQKLNFVLTPPTTANQAANTFSQLTGSNVAAAVSGTAQQPPQIQLQLQPNMQLQQQQTTQANAANILTNLAPLLQQSVNMTAPLPAATGAASMLSPNKCFLPITIKDENSDQQIVAHIDAKNFVFPATYQLQMKLEPQIATVNGQTLMLQPTSIPATIQLTPQALTQQTFQALLNTSANQMQQPQIMQQIQQQTQQQQQQQEQQQQQQQQQLQQIQFTQTVPTTNNLQITSQQILRAANSNNDVGMAPTTEQQQENQKPKIQATNTISQQKFKITQLPGNAFEITPTNDYEPATTTAKPPVVQKSTPPKQHQQQQQAQNQVTIPASLPTQYGGITVQRISSATKPNATATIAATTNQKSQEQQQQQQITQAAKTTLKIENKTNVWQKQNLTISRIPSAQQQQQQQTQLKTVASNVKTAQPQQNQKLLVQSTMQANDSSSPTKTPTTQQQNQFQQETQFTRQPSPAKKVVKRVVGKTATTAANNKPTQPPPQLEPAAVIKIETIPTLGKSLTITTAPATTVTPPTTTAATRVTINKKDNANTATKSTATTADNSNATTTATATGTGTTQPTQGFECGTCHRVFKKKEHLTQHVKLHAGIRPFKCNQAGCDKDFSRKEHLLRHIVSHSGEKQFSCDVCEKPFSRKDNLNKHRRIHSSAQNASSHLCEICNKSFAIKSHYEEHKALHAKQETETKPQPKKPAKPQQRTITIQQQQQPQHQQQHQQPQQQQQTQQIQFVQHQPTHHQQTMHLQLPTVVTTQDLAGNTITITQSADPTKANLLNLPSHLANFVQLGQTQFVNAATGQLVSHIKIDK